MALFVCARTWSLLLLALTFAFAASACGDGTAREPEVAKVTAADRDALFAKLTASTWCNRARVSAPERLAPSAIRYTLSSDGAYDLIQSSDYVEREGAGSWNFTATTPDGGMLFLDNGDAIRFHFVAADVLSLDFKPMDACQALTATGNAAGLPKVKGSALFTALVSGTWYLNGDRDLVFQPTSIRYRADGTFTADFRYGECSESGSWSLQDGQVTLQRPLQGCNPRPNPQGLTLWSYAMRLQGNGLMTGRDYYSRMPWKQGGDTTVASYSPSAYAVTITYAAMTRGKAVDLNIEITNLSRFDRTVRSVEVAAGPAPAKPTEVVGSKPLGEIPLLPGGTERFTVMASPQSSGTVAFEVKLNGTFRNQRTEQSIKVGFEATVAEP
jgi:hypothetical protein